MSTLKVGGLTHREVLKNAERLESDLDARRSGAEQMRERVAKVPQATFAQMQGHAPSESYEAGFADACRECEVSIRALPLE